MPEKVKNSAFVDPLSRFGLSVKNIPNQPPSGQGILRMEGKHGRWESCRCS
jgi:hypothetical protein